MQSIDGENVQFVLHSHTNRTEVTSLLAVVVLFCRL